MIGRSVLIFDMDGTLVDSMNDHADAFASILSGRFLLPIDDMTNLYHESSGMPLDEQFRMATQGIDGNANVDSLIAEFWQAVDTFPVSLYPDVEDGLRNLKNLGFRLFVSSGCSSEIVQSKLTRVGIIHYFELALGTGYGRPKSGKGRAHFTRVRDYLNLSQPLFEESAAMVGDSEYDMAVSQAAGIMAIGRPTEVSTERLMNAGATATIQSLHELPQLLKYP